jgi:hypothetical protein
MVDMAHYAGLIAAGVYPNPVPHADVVTSTTHKSLRGPRGGIILMKSQHEKAINSAIFPGLQGGPLMHVIAAKAVAFKEALHARVQGLPAAGGQERPGRGRDAHPARPAHRQRPHRKPRHAGRPALQGHHRQGSRGRAGQRPHDHQQERDPERPGKADGHQRRAHRHPGHDHPRLQGRRGAHHRQPGRRRAGTRATRPTSRGARQGQRPDPPLPGLQTRPHEVPVLRHAETQVVETRVAEDADFIRRRRQCAPARSASPPTSGPTSTSRSSSRRTARASTTSAPSCGLDDAGAAQAPR